ncbi:TetR/AcrR family transcriptional regulator [Streptomyces sp. SID13031]|uniref:TetR/AcrR family transcriptional regulator n=1 Tax=Streptomyces sp. SID13031 TaxID=2706046 RepID=UPI0013CCA8BB|nr:TetR/AcrR family transcriptional regulator [Streptomyces sp. SID13031]NEA30211.1 TetR/AcrR family transcriptional regulator [Streptomyces sp. SID13031]
MATNAERSASRRREILAAASAMFATKGFHKASLQEVAAAAGITPAGLLHHFGSKDQLLTELLAHRDASEIAEVNDPERPHGTAFLDHLAVTAERNSERRGLTQLYVVLSADGVTDDHPAQDYFRSRYDGLRSMIANEIRLAQAAGEVSGEKDPQEIATLIIAVMDGLQIQWLYNPDSVDMGGLVRKLITVLTAD